MWRLALPILAEQLLVILVAFVDQWLAGNYLEAPHLAAIGFIWYALWALPTMFSLVSTGATALTARFVGAKEFDNARDVVNQSLVAGLVLSVAVIALLVVGIDGFLHLMQLEGEAAPLAKQYLQIIMPVIPLIMLEEIGIACLRGAGDTASGLLVRLMVNVINLGLGVTLVTGAFGMPRYGWQGLAIATSAGFAVGGLAVGALLLRGRAGLQLQTERLWPRPILLKRILRIGVPGGADAIGTVVIHLWFLAIINGLGILPAAAHGLAVRIEALTYLPGAAFLVAAATMTGQSLGAGAPRRAVRSALLCLAWGGGIMATAALGMYVFADPLTQFFLGKQNREVAAEAAALLRIVALSLPQFSVLMILSGAMRGAGDTRWALLITFLGLLLIRIPLSYLWATDTGLPFMAGWGWGVRGAWYAMLVDITLRGALTLGRFVQGGWQRIHV